MVINNVLSSIE